MGSWAGLLGVLLGGLLAFVGQGLLSATARTRERAELILEQCAQIVVQETRFRRAVGQERFGSVGKVAEWTAETGDLMVARLRIVCHDTGLLSALDGLTTSGRTLARAWSDHPEDEAIVEAASVRHEEALDRFIAASRYQYRRRRP